VSPTATTAADQRAPHSPHLTLTLTYPDTDVFACLEGRLLSAEEDDLDPGELNSYQAARPLWLVRDSRCVADGQCECEELSLWEAIDYAPPARTSELVRTHTAALRRETAHLKLLALQVAGAPTPESDGAVPVCARCILDPREHLEQLSRSVGALGWELASCFSLDPHPNQLGR